MYKSSTEGRRIQTMRHISGITKRVPAAADEKGITSCGPLKQILGKCRLA